MKNKLTKCSSGLIILLFTVSLTFQSCKDNDKLTDIIDYVLSILNKTGWLVNDENLDNIPDDITPFDEDSNNLKPAVLLESKFPPIGDQGQYGTCVVWAVGYNLKTALNGIEKGWSSNQLADKNNQTSPKDLWYAIPASKRGNNCQGTNFEPAMDALIATGSASLNSVPYKDMGNCSGQAQGNKGNKLANYRKIAYNEDGKSEGMTLDNFKGYLNSGRPIAFGAKLGDRFMTWNSGAVISSDTYNNPGMQHAYHAMTLSGYDDTKNAFRVRNSWGTSWGDNGSIWVDYHFFLKNFCFAAFVAQNVNSTSVNEGGISSGLASGTDLLAYYAEDDNDPDYTDKRRRLFSYEVYNSGNTTIYPSQNWSVVYMYYNAVNANDYKIIFEDYYTADKGEGGGEYDSPAAIAGGWWNNAEVKPGKLAGEAEYTNGFEIAYLMPNITGKYYLVVMADAYDKIAEVNEDNNFYFISANGKPLEFQNGVIKNMPSKTSMLLKGKRPRQYADTETQTLVKPGNMNTYTPDELKVMLIHDKRTGKLDRAVKEYRLKGERNFTKRKK